MKYSMNKTINQILSNLQGDVTDLANFIAGGVVTPPNTTAALALVQNDLSSVNSLLQAIPLNLSAVVAALATAQADLNALAALLVGGVSGLPINPATGLPYNSWDINPATGLPFNQTNSGQPASFVGQPGQVNVSPQQVQVNAVNPQTGLPFNQPIAQPFAPAARNMVNGRFV